MERRRRVKKQKKALKHFDPVFQKTNPPLKQFDALISGIGSKISECFPKVLKEERAKE